MPPAFSAMKVRKLDDRAAPDLLARAGRTHRLDKSFLPAMRLDVPRTSDGRVFFAIPWHGRVLIGTTDTEVSKAVLEPRPLKTEIEFLLEHAARYLEKKPRHRIF